MKKPLRLWPGVAAVALMWLLRFVVPVVLPDLGGQALLAGLGLVLVVLAWWLFFSRAPWAERIGALVIMAAALAVAWRFLHPSIAGGGMGILPLLFAIPLLSLALVAWAAITGGAAPRVRRVALVAAAIIACVPLLLIRTDGMRSGGSDLAWRWTPTAEQKLLAQTRDEPVVAPVVAVAAPPEPASPQAPADALAETTLAAPPPEAAAAAVEPAAAPAVIAPPAWPGFRGPARDGVVRGITIATDWASTPPVKLWSHPIGPGWSSFAVQGDFIYTQEQRGDDEMVSCYRLSTGEPVWRHRDAVRFWESNAGAGPRATPTLHNARVYTFGATGILNALDAATGARVWSRNVGTDVQRNVPGWGFTSSPVVIDGIVIVAASGSLAGYDAATGDHRWTGARQLGSYSSPHRATIHGVEQVLLLTGSGVAAFNPADGTLLWENNYDGGTPIVQPAVIADGDLLTNAISMTGGDGITRLAVARNGDGWTVQERWQSRGLKPYFNDFVVHDGHAYGFDGAILSSIALDDGARNWKGGRYGQGQMILLADQNLLLVLSEDGELALVSATPDKYTEIAKAPALDGKTWNHPVVVGDILLVRNGEEMAAFRLPLAGR